MSEMVVLKLAGRERQRRLQHRLRAQEQANRQAQQDIRRLRRRCFWTRPWGHVWEEIPGTRRQGSTYDYWRVRCAGCGWVQGRRDD